jgi:chromate reductase
MHILGIVGSLRQGSFNRMLLREAFRLAPPKVETQTAELAGIPLYDGDLEEHDYPVPVNSLKDAIRAADGILLASPEYNYSIPGVVKNAIDWTSRPAKDIPWKGKPVAIMGASSGRFGTVRGQQHLRLVLFAVGAMVLNQPEILVGPAKEAFDGEGHLTDERVLGQMAKLWPAFLAWIDRVRE